MTTAAVADVSSHPEECGLIVDLLNFVVLTGSSRVLDSSGRVQRVPAPGVATRAEPPVGAAATDTDCCAMVVHQQTRRDCLSGLGSRRSEAIRPLPDSHATCGGWNTLGRAAGSRAVPSQSTSEPTQHRTCCALCLEIRCEQGKLPSVHLLWQSGFNADAATNGTR